jgi:hypothetical protein
VTPRTYRLARTYAPSADFAERLARVCPDPHQLCKAAGIAASTYARIVRQRSASRHSAERVAQFYALAEGYDRRVAFAMLFVPNPPMEMCATCQRRIGPGGLASGQRQASSGCGARTLP